MDKEDSGQHPRGFANTLIGGINNGATIVRGMRLARAGGAAVGAVGSLGPIAIGVGTALVIVVFLVVLTQGTGFAENAPETGNPQTGTPAPLPVGGNVRQAIIDNFGITMDGFDERHINAAWEMISETANTNFPSLVRGAKIQAVSGNSSSQVGCKGTTSVNLAQHEPLDFFKYILTHELGHFIRNCQLPSASKYEGHVRAYEQEGAVSFYGANARICTGSDNLSEDYADTISYYLNPRAGFATTVCGGRAPINPPNPLHVAPIKILHYNVARDILTKR